MNIYELQATLTLDISAFRQSAEEAGALFEAFAAEAESLGGVQSALDGLTASAAQWTGELSALFAETADAAAQVVSGGEAVTTVLGETIPSAAGSALAAVAELPGEFASVGAEMASGLGSGFSSLWDSVSGAIGKKISSLVSSVKDLLGIRSPSRVFAEIGGNMAKGLAAGWETEYASALRAISLGEFAGSYGRSAEAADRIGFGDSAIGRSSSAGISSLMAAGAGGFASDAGRPIEIRLLLDGDVAAEALIDPLRRTAARRDLTAEGGGLYA
jgi:hypothetical protein